MKALLIIPTYNEIKNIGRIIPAALGQAPELEILVMDDNSPTAPPRKWPGSWRASRVSI